MTNETRTLTIRYAGGGSHKFSFPLPIQDKANAAQRVLDILKGDHLLLEMKGRMIIIPFQAIQMIEISPAPEKLPPNTLKNVQLVSK